MDKIGDFVDLISMHFVSLRISLTVSAWAMLAVMLNAGEIEKAAIIKINESLETTPGDAQTFLKRGDLYRLDAEYRLALKDIDTAEKLNPGFPEIEFARAQVYRNINRLELTEQHLLRFLDLEPNDLKGLRLLATLYTEQERFREADVIYGRIIATFDSPPLSFYFIRSRNRESYGDFEGALAVITEAMEAAEWTPMLENRAIEYEIKLGAYSSAIDRVNSLIEREPKQSFRHYQKKADILLLSGDPAAAKENYQLGLESLDALYPSLSNLPGLKALRDSLVASVDSLQ